MSGISGKTRGILQRLPHFFHVDEMTEGEQQASLLVHFVDLFGRRLEQADDDAYRMARSHHVETADNRIFAANNAPFGNRADLDKIFALYLEALGGTAFLVKTSPRFTLRSFDARMLSEALSAAADPTMAYVKDKAAATLADLFLSKDPEATNTVAALLPAANAGKNLQSDIRQSFDDLLARRLISKAWCTPQEIKPGFALALLLAKPQSPGGYIRDRLMPATQTLLNAYNGGGSLDPRLPSALSTDLNRWLLRDPGFFPFFLKNQIDLGALKLSADAWDLIRGIYADNLRERYLREPDAKTRQSLLSTLDNAEHCSVPPGDDLVRLNRMLLEAVFPASAGLDWGFAAGNSPSPGDLRKVLVGFLNALVQADGLFAESRPEELEEPYFEAKRQYPGQTEWFNRALLEAVFPIEIEKSYAPYRNRMLGLIQVLRRGASTRQGIVDIVAANLGIVDDDPLSRAAKSKIQIEEFAPQRTTTFDDLRNIFEEIQVKNAGISPESPEIWVTLLDNAKPLRNVRFTDAATGQVLVLSGCTVKPGDVLSFKGDTVLLNSVPPPERLIGQVPAVRPGISKWRFEADFVSGVPGRFDKTCFDQSVFAGTAPVVRVTVFSHQITPGIFEVTTPWHIAGFTDQFPDGEGHPRNQILNLVNRVRAAGVEARVKYVQTFTEDQNQEDLLTVGLGGALLSESLDLTDDLKVSNRQDLTEDQDINDKLSLAGRFDWAQFDGLNTFAQ